MLERIPASYFESMGLACGFLACGTIAAQVLSEYANPGPSSLSPIYSLGFLLIFVFWTVYGLRFHRLALWLTNGLAVILQGLLICLTLG